MLATFAQFERRLISQRTKEALAVKKAQGVGLGSREAGSGGRGGTVRNVCSGTSEPCWRRDSASARPTLPRDVAFGCAGPPRAPALVAWAGRRFPPTFSCCSSQIPGDERGGLTEKENTGGCRDR